jgi:hypothetical protein
MHGFGLELRHIVFTNHDHVHRLSRQGRPHKDKSVGPDKSWHQPPWCVIVKSALRARPDLRGALRLPFRGYDVKKDSPMLMRLAKDTYVALRKAQE